MIRPRARYRAGSRIQAPYLGESSTVEGNGLRGSAAEESGTGEAVRSQPVLFLPGNGHDPVRLEGVRGEMRRQAAPFELIEAAYGKADSYEELLATLEANHAEWHARHPGALIYATGIGGLVALSLRARGAFPGHPLVIQGLSLIHI